VPSFPPTTTPGWRKHTPPRKERYWNAVTSIETVDMIQGKYTVTDDFAEKVKWLTHVWDNLQFLAWFATIPQPLELLPRARAGWGLRQHNDRTEILIGTDPVSDVVLATMIGVAGRGQGLIHTPVKSLSYDSGTVTIATAALLTMNPARAKEFWDIMSAVGIRGATPPNPAGWSPQTWGETP